MEREREGDSSCRRSLAMHSAVICPLQVNGAIATSLTVQRRASKWMYVYIDYIASQNGATLITLQP